jgi:hypothetical protein
MIVRAILLVVLRVVDLRQRRIVASVGTGPGPECSWSKRGMQTKTVSGG